MTTQWERNIDSFQRLQTDLGFSDTLRVYNASASYDPDTGDTTKIYVEVDETPSGPDLESPIDAEIVPPSETGRQEVAGTEIEADAVIFVRDDTGIDFREYGEPSEAATEVESVRTGVRYRVETVNDEYNGLLMLTVTEL